jgi:DNA polymerase III delta prime subunit
MSREHRILFEGPAGTGKTLLAIEEARRALSRDEKTLFLCYNRLLVKYISSSVEGVSLYSGTIHSFISQNEAFPDSAFPESSAAFSELTQKLKESRLLASSFDVIIVDEIQDFCSIGADDLLKEIIDQNPGAKVRLFGDFENQAVQFGKFVSQEQFVQKFWSLRTYPLTRNCRNRPGVGTAIELYTQKQDLYLGYRLPETKNNLKIVLANSEKDRLARCESEFLRLARTYLPSNIVILGLTQEVSIKDLSENMTRVLTNDYSLWKDAGSKALSTTVRKFKGLDAQAVILTHLPSEPDMDLLYTGMSRAIEEVILIAPQVVLTRFLGIPSL